MAGQTLETRALAPTWLTNICQRENKSCTTNNPKKMTLAGEKKEKKKHRVVNKGKSCAEKLKPGRNRKPGGKCTNSTRGAKGFVRTQGGWGKRNGKL